MQGEKDPTLSLPPWEQSTSLDILQWLDPLEQATRKYFSSSEIGLRNGKLKRIICGFDKAFPTLPDTHRYISEVEEFLRLYSNLSVEDQLNYYIKGYVQNFRVMYHILNSFVKKHKEAGNGVNLYDVHMVAHRKKSMGTVLRRDGYYRPFSEALSGAQ